MTPGPPELEERYRRFLEGRGDDIDPLFRFLRGDRRARTGTEAWAALILSRIYLLRGAIELASSFLRVASSRAGGAPQSLRLGILVNRALVCRARGRTAEAAALLRAVVDRALRSGEMLVAAKAASNGALCLARLGYPDEACSYAGLAERTYGAMNEREGLARIALTRAVIDARRGRRDEAIDRLARSLREWGGRERERERLIALLLLAETYLAGHEHDRAAYVLEDASTMKDALARFAPQRGRLLHLQHVIYRSTGDADAAHRCAEAARRLRRTLGMGSGAPGPPAAAEAREAPPCAPALARSRAEGDEDSFITADPAMNGLLERIRRAARFRVPILIRGESGVGKDLVARLVHRWGGGDARPFVPVNVASIPAELFESVLFGHARGAFTGAVCARPGLVSAAAGGTLFLDEIGELPLALQPKLLRFIDRGEYYALGETSQRRSEARIVCATNRDLAAACGAGAFREDLYRRIAAISFVIPPLRERRGDIPILAEHLLERLRIRHGMDPVRLHAEAAAALVSWRWPGNARELESVLLGAVLRARAGSIRAGDLPPEIIAPARCEGAGTGDLRSRERSMRRERIVAVLHDCGGNRSRAAAALGLKRTTLIGMMKRLGIA